MDRIKKIKVKKADGTMTDYIPIGVDARNVDLESGKNLEETLNKKSFYYNTVSEMVQDKDLSNGDMCWTLGYNYMNDGGSALYKIVSSNENIEAYEKLSNNNYAELIFDEYINIKQLGAYGDGIHDDTDIFKKAMELNKNIYIPNGTYIITSSVTIPFNIKITGEHKMKTIIKSTIKNDYIFYYGTEYNYNSLGGIIENLQFTSDNVVAEKPFGIYLKSSLTLKNIRFYRIGKCLDRTSQYIDVLKLDDVYLGYCVPNGDYLIRNGGNNDALSINNLKVAAYTGDRTIYNGIYIARCHGGCIKNSIPNFNVIIELTNAFSIENSHFEDPNFHINIQDSQISIKDCFRHKSSIDQGNDIIITNSGYDKSNLILIENMVFFIMGKMYDSNESYYSKEICELPSNTVLKLSNVYRQLNFADNGRTLGNTFGILLENFDKFNDNSSKYSIDSIVTNTQQIYSSSLGKNDVEKASGSIGAAVLNTQGGVWRAEENGTIYFKAISLRDEERKISMGASLEGSVENVTKNGGAISHALNRIWGSGIVFYWGTSSLSYTKKTFIPSIGRGVVYNNGVNMNGYKTETVSATNATSNYNIVDAYTTDGENVTIWYSKTPTLGVWKKGDKCINTNISSGQVISWIYDGASWISTGTYE